MSSEYEEVAAVVTGRGGTDAVGERHRDTDVDWQDIRALRAKTTAGRSPRPYVSFRRADPSTFSGASDKRSTIMPNVWSLDPNGLISLIDFMVENPMARAEVTPAQFEAMLAGPPRPSGKWWD